MSRQLLTFRLEGMLAGIDIDAVQEVHRGGKVTSAPLAADGVRGILNLRGQIVTVIDARARLGIAPSGAPGETHLIVKAGNESVSLLVDGEGDVFEVDESARQALPATAPAEIATLAESVYEVPGGLVVVLDVERMAAPAGSEIGDGNPMEVLRARDGGR